MSLRLATAGSTPKNEQLDPPGLSEKHILTKYLVIDLIRYPKLPFKRDQKRSLTYWEKKYEKASYLLLININDIENKFESNSLRAKKYNKQDKGVWGMPRLSEAKKDVISCDKLRGVAHTL